LSLLLLLLLLLWVTHALLSPRTISAAALPADVLR
jgi:hypothetical protein